MWVTGDIRALSYCDGKGNVKTSIVVNETLPTKAFGDGLQREGEPVPAGHSNRHHTNDILSSFVLL